MRPTRHAHARHLLLLPLAAALFVVVGCATTVRVPAGPASAAGPARTGGTAGATALVEFSYAVTRGGDRGRWVLESAGVRTLAESVQLPAFEMHVFDDDGDGVMQPGEITSSVVVRVGTPNRSAYVSPLVIGHGVADPWIHARAETSAGVVERTWRFEPP